METLKRRIIGAAKLVISVLATAAVLVGLSHVASPKNNQSAFGMINAEANGAQAERAASLDVLFIGDSEAFSSFSPLQLWSERGIASYVCATSSQSLPYTRTLLLRALRTQKPRVVVLETNSVFARFSASDALARLAADALPVVEYHNRWKSLRPEDLTSSVQATWTDDLKGFRLNGRVCAATFTDHMTATDAVERPGLLNRLYLADIQRICKDNGIKLVLLSTPSTVNWSRARHNGMQAWAADNDVDYIDLNCGEDAVEIDWNQDTSDAGDHLNLRGAQKVTTAVGALLAQRYGLASHAGDRAYTAWDDAYARYVQQVTALQWTAGTATGATPVAQR